MGKGVKIFLPSYLRAGHVGLGWGNIVADKKKRRETEIAGR